jgi:hypothetical protein
VKVEVWVYRRKEYKQLRFFVNGQTGSIYRKGNKKLNFSRLLSRTKLEKRDPMIGYSIPDKEYSFDLPYGRLGNTDLGICVGR